ncbi:hypothetical protein RHS01_04592 [Rhizoctonia solani]|uniref:Uncharacterized protein n=1 Tax=Rhizoctonia solani TaxID=456999 RepID=A0A8H7IEP1_9AGAM|nr:hypothetical protein RHS01_04592 [Rhizoctonia solani]
MEERGRGEDPMRQAWAERSSHSGSVDRAQSRAAAGCIVQDKRKLIMMDGKVRTVIQAAVVYSSTSRSANNIRCPRREQCAYVEEQSVLTASVGEYGYNGSIHSDQTVLIGETYR